MRRRARFLRKARELAFRDLGGLVFDIHRFGERNDRVLAAKLATLRQIDTELRALETALHERRPVTVLHEVGIAACPRCAAIHGGDDRFCPGCGLAFDSHADRPLATAPMGSHVAPAQSAPSDQPGAGLTTGRANQPGAGLTSGPGSPPASGLTIPPADAAAPAPKPERQPPPAPPITPTAQPVAARPGERPQPDTSEDQPTQIVRPPVSGG